jgi:hypothetical protein
VLNITQKDLAMTSGTGLRFIIDLEKGKPTCQLEKVLTILHMLGIKLNINPPVDLESFNGGGSGSGAGAGNGDGSGRG